MEIKLNFLHILTLIFVVAKLFNFIHWSWWLVFLPSLISFGIGILLILFALLLVILDEV